MRRRLEAAEIVVVAIDSLSGWQSKKKHKHHYRPSTFLTVYFQKVFGLFSFYRLYFQNICLIWQ
jgi:hypothetical protein